MPQFTAQGSMFEGLYVHALRVDPEGAFADQLRGVGFDLREVRAQYDISVWVGGLDLCWRRQHPGLARYDAWRKIGRQFIEGYLETVVGRFIGVALPLMSAARFVPHIPLYVRTGLGGVTCEVESLGERAALVSMGGPHEGASHLLSGVLEGCFERLHAEGTFEPTLLGGVDSSLRVSWTD